MKRMMLLSLAAALLFAGSPAVNAQSWGPQLLNLVQNDTPDEEEIQPGWFKPFWLTLIFHTDGESQLINAGSGLEDFGGVARFATLVDDLRYEAKKGARTPLQRQLGGSRGAVVVSAGDNFLAGPEFNASLTNGVPYFDSIAQDLIEYDAIAIGNHEFDFGPDVLADYIEGFQVSDPKFVAANLDFSNEPRLNAFVNDGVIVKSTIVRQRGRRIGIIGATTEDLPFISSPRDTIINEVAPAVQSEVIRLFFRGVTRIVLVSHLQGIDNDIDLLSELWGIDVAIAGGGGDLLASEGDLLVPGDEIEGPFPTFASDRFGREVPIVTTTGDYRYAGQITLGFDFFGRVIAIDPDRSGPVRVAGGTNADAVMPDALVQSLAVNPVIDSVATLAVNVLATSEVGLDGVRNNVRTQETNLGNLIADSMLWQANQEAASFGAPLADVALQNGGGIRNDSVIPAGDITELDTFDILPFLNFVTIVPDVTRENFKEVLENAVSAVEFTSGRFAQVAGFSFSYSTAGTAQDIVDGVIVTPGSRVIDVTLDDGTPIVQGGAVVPGPGINIAIADFLARGGDEYPLPATFTTVGVTYQQALANYIQQALGGNVNSVDYPEGGSGRIVQN